MLNNYLYYKRITSLMMFFKLWYQINKTEIFTSSFFVFPNISLWQKCNTMMHMHVHAMLICRCIYITINWIVLCSYTSWFSYILHNVCKHLVNLVLWYQRPVCQIVICKQYVHTYMTGSFNVIVLIQIEPFWIISVNVYISSNCVIVQRLLLLYFDSIYKWK